jgi:hypothetical protein
LPKAWQQLWEMLPDKRRAVDAWEPAVPLILAAWHETPAMLKMVRLAEHIQWAEKHNALPEVAALIGIVVVAALAASAAALLPGVAITATRRQTRSAMSDGRRLTAPRFRTIQGWPKDRPIPPCYAEHAADRLHGLGRLCQALSGAG